MLKICYLYPDLLNLHGNWGNMAALLKRCEWRQIDVKIIGVNLGDPVDFEQVDIIYLGTGSEQERNLVLEDMMPRRNNLFQAIEKGVVMLAVGSGSQVLGMYRLNEDGQRLPGLGLIKIYTQMTAQPLVGDCVASMQFRGENIRLVGFENHNEHTYLGPDLPPLGRVLHGHGNNGTDGMEGFRYNNVFGTNMGPLLPKNPMFADVLLGTALQNKGEPVNFPALDNSLEEQAAQVMMKRLLAY
jgi:CobQ-like glutamine amidotransferase family enzyme